MPFNPIALAAALLLATAVASPAAPAAQAVAIQDYAFKPATITVTAGTTVIWTQKDDDPHTVTADDASFDSKGLGQGDTFKRVFDKPGRYPYHCAAHPFMKGVVVVTEVTSR
jgi:plastocyanin